MKKKSLIAMGISLSMVLAMATPAFAANTNADGTEVTKPGHPVYDGTNTQVAGESYNNATASSIDGATWKIINDDDAVAEANDTTADINVWAKVKDDKPKAYKVDFAWGAMKFEYDAGGGVWDPVTHTYNRAGKTALWTVTDYLDGANNKVAVTNHSNNAINAAFVYKMEGTKFNDANGQNNVIGNFFDDNAKAVTAATVLTNTYTDAAGNTVNDAAVSNKLAGPVKLATADAYNNGTANQTAGARTDNVFFAFSGTPDAGKDVALKDFTKVGVITVTVTPNADLNLNQPPTK